MHRAAVHTGLIRSHSRMQRLGNGCRRRQTPSAVHSVPVEPQMLVSLAEGSQSTFITATAWAVVASATGASLWYMSRAFLEAKTAIERRQEGEQLKQQEDTDKEAARKQKIKQMFDRI